MVFDKLARNSPSGQSGCASRPGCWCSCQCYGPAALCRKTLRVPDAQPDGAFSCL